MPLEKYSSSLPRTPDRSVGTPADSDKSLRFRNLRTRPASPEERAEERETARKNLAGAWNIMLDEDAPFNQLKQRPIDTGRAINQARQARHQGILARQAEEYTAKNEVARRERAAVDTLLRSNDPELTAGGVVDLDPDLNLYPDSPVVARSERPTLTEIMARSRTGGVPRYTQEQREADRATIDRQQILADLDDLQRKTAKNSERSRNEAIDDVYDFSSPTSSLEPTPEAVRRNRLAWSRQKMEARRAVDAGPELMFGADVDIDPNDLLAEQSLEQLRKPERRVQKPTEQFQQAQERRTEIPQTIRPMSRADVQARQRETTLANLRANQAAAQESASSMNTEMRYTTEGMQELSNSFEARFGVNLDALQMGGASLLQEVKLGAFGALASLGKLFGKKTESPQSFVAEYKIKAAHLANLAAEQRKYMDDAKRLQRSIAEMEDPVAEQARREKTAVDALAKVVGRAGRRVAQHEGTVLDEGRLRNAPTENQWYNEGDPSVSPFSDEMNAKLYAEERGRAERPATVHAEPPYESLRAVPPTREAYAPYDWQEPAPARAESARQPADQSFGDFLNAQWADLPPEQHATNKKNNPFARPMAGLSGESRLDRGIDAQESRRDDEPTEKQRQTPVSEETQTVLLGATDKTLNLLKLDTLMGAEEQLATAQKFLARKLRIELHSDRHPEFDRSPLLTIPAILEDVQVAFENLIKDDSVAGILDSAKSLDRIINKSVDALRQLETNPSASIQEVRAIRDVLYRFLELRASQAEHFASLIDLRAKDPKKQILIPRTDGSYSLGYVIAADAGLTQVYFKDRATGREMRKNIPTSTLAVYQLGGLVMRERIGEYWT